MSSLIRALCILAVLAVAAGFSEPQKAKRLSFNYNRNGYDWPGMCSKGLMQSPIPIATVEAKKLGVKGLRLDFGVAKGLKIVNSGHSIKVQWSELSGCKARIPSRGMWGTKIYDTVAVKPFQMVFHTSSEHVVNGVEASVELHLITRVVYNAPDVPSECKDPRKPCLAIFAIMFSFDDFPLRAKNQTSYISSTFDAFMAKIPSTTGREGATVLPYATFDLNALLPIGSPIAWYKGSLTAPPCSEGVSWHVFTKAKQELAGNHLNLLKAAMATTVIELPDCEVNGLKVPCRVQSRARSNNRGLQRLNGRKVYVMSINDEE